MERIVVGVDESECAGRALSWAADVAERHGAELEALLSWGYLDQHGVEPGREFDPDYHEGDAAAALEAIVERVLGERAGAVTRRVDNDLASHSLVAASEDADLVVVGARGLGSIRGALIGSVSQHVLHHAACPVAVVHDAPAPPSGRPRIVVGVDGSDVAQEALTWAVAEARAMGAELDVVSAWHPPYLGAYPFDPGALNLDAFEQGARDVVEAAVGKVDTRDLVAPPQVITVSDTPARAILDTAAGADLVVIGSRGRGGFVGLLLGSVSTQVANHAPCPVVVVRDRT
jgi:nucleotide-binding universal stress UspA family protein